MKFANIYKQSEDRMRLALLSLWAPGRHPMRTALKQLFDREDERLVQEPVFQSTFGWESTIGDNWRSYLNRSVIDKLKIGHKYLPYKHQAESWKELKDGNSIVVTSGTGSGKTECFMYPVISDLYEQTKANAIQAIFLYPLNALMEDQKKRLNDYCKPLGLKFAVYNGDTPQFRKDGNGEVFSNEVATREEIRDMDGKGTRPQILLTNPSMLEYILVRKSDQKMLQESSGKLRWIVIDEAHSYSGSAAVELSYQIKRILDAFGTRASHVRFACTSATIGGENGAQSLAKFISTITGQPETQIKVIGGNRLLPELDEKRLAATLKDHNLPDVKEVMSLRKKINSINGIRLGQIWTELGMKGDCDEVQALKLVDELCELRQDDKPVLSLRAHFFMRTVNGLYACANESCPGTSGTPFGHITTKNSAVCECCGKPLLELVQCKRCRSFILMGQNDNSGLVSQCDESRRQDDYFAIESTEEEDEEEALSPTLPSNTFFIVPNKEGETIHPVAKAHIGTLDIEFRQNYAYLQQNRECKGSWRDLRKDDSHAYCPNCGKLAHGKRLNFKHFRIPVSFANQIVSPILLHECATNEASWGKYIAFTDSRQGTAISAKTFNINVERTECREKAMRLFASMSEGNGLTKEQKEILASIPEPNRAIVEAALILNNKSSEGTVTLYDLSQEIFVRQIFDHITTTEDDKAAYKAALLRSFVGRKPLYETNAETMGLLTLVYPALKNVRMPNSLVDYCDANNVGLADKDWQDYLKLLLDYFVRMGNHIQPLADGERKYIRESNISTPIAGPNDMRTGVAHWPSLKMEDNNYITQQPRSILLLCAALNISNIEKLQNSAMTLTEIINDAWVQLIDNKILKEVKADDTEGYNNPRFFKDNKYVGCFYLDLSGKETNKTAVIVRTREVWACPVTQTLLDTTFCGYSPLMVGEISRALFDRYKCDPQKIVMPKRPKEEDDIDEWISKDNDVQNLKDQGFWTNRYDETYKVRPAYIAAEHSAQQSKELLRKYTKLFSQENPAINVLHCSTTMEMGVDIGSIDTVVMDTIPPTAANYLQRVGRAGRMGQTKALAFSLCNNTPVGQNTFANPMWALDTTNHMIKVKESATIVQRHANSFFFRQFICDNGDGIQATMNVKEFMDNIYQEFLTFIDVISTQKAEEDKFHTVFGQSTRFSIETTRKAIVNIYGQYNNVIKELEEAFETYKDDPKRQLAISNQRKKYENISLLNFLSDNQFIPNANMPTGVVTFDFTDKDQASKLHILYGQADKLRHQINIETSTMEKKLLESELGNVRKKINSIQKSTSASRDIRTALNEYAPEQTVVVNEKNYVSAGVTLFGAYNEKTQSRGLYYCKHCGHVEYMLSLDEHKKCPLCSEPYYSIIDKKGRNGKGYTLAYEPIGFRTDQNVEGSREERTEKHYYDIRPILLSADWTKRIDINLCQITSSGENGELLFYNAGNGYGFAFCKRCGRAAVENTIFNTNEDNLPSTLRPGHNRLLGDTCESNVNDIARNVVFTGNHPTCYSVFRFLKKPNSIEYENDEELVYTMGVVLTRALAKYIGIDEGEIDFGVKQEADKWLLFIYDTAKGGCGYSLRFVVAADCQNIFNIALDTLKNAHCDCERSEGACTSCLIDRQSYRFADKLSKAKAMDWLERQKRNSVVVSDDILKNSANARVVYQGIKHIARQAANSRETKKLTFCVSDITSDYAIQNWKSIKSEMGRIVRQAIDNSIDVKILVEYHPEYHLSLADKLPFTDLQNKFADCSIQFISDMGTVKTMLVVESADGIKRYFTDKAEMLSFSNKWGSDCFTIYTDEENISFTNVSAPKYEYSTKNIVREGLSEAKSFSVGKYFSEGIAKSVLHPSDLDVMTEILHGQKADITFSDMYVNSALASLMLTYLIDEMRSLFGFTIRDITLQLDSPRRKCVNGNLKDDTPIFLNFDSAVAADEYTDALIEDVLGIAPEHSHLDANHHRWLRIASSKGTVEIRPDHGISGGWKSNATYMSIHRLDGNTFVKRHREDEEILYYVIIKRK